MGQHQVDGERSGGALCGDWRAPWSCDICSVAGILDLQLFYRKKVGGAIPSCSQATVKMVDPKFVEQFFGCQNSLGTVTISKEWSQAAAAALEGGEAAPEPWCERERNTRHESILIHLNKLFKKRLVKLKE